MSWAAELGVPPVDPGAGASLRLLAGAARARSVVEVGTGTGVSGLWLLRGMRPDGVLTSIDVEPEHQKLARQSFAAAGYATGRARLINGSARDVLPRLADGAYDLVFVDGDVDDYAYCTGAAHRLLRDGGVLIVAQALGGVGPRAAVIVDELVAYLAAAPEWVSTVLPGGIGLLCAVKS